MRSLLCPWFIVFSALLAGCEPELADDTATQGAIVPDGRQGERACQELDVIVVQEAGIGVVYHLSALPCPGSVQVSVDINGLVYRFNEGEDWVFEPVPNAVAFTEYIPTIGHELYIEYALANSELDCSHCPIAVD